MKNRGVLIAVAVVVIAIIGVGGAYFVAKHSNNSGPTPTPAPQQEEQVLSLSPSDIGLTLNPITSGKFANNGVELDINKLDGIASIDYELDYTSTGNIPRGAIGHVDIKPSQTTFSQQLPFGTCSDFCHFDKDVSNVKVTLKVTKQDGKIYQVTSTYNP